MTVPRLFLISAVTATAILSFAGAAAYAGGMPPEFEIDANGEPLDSGPAVEVVEPEVATASMFEESFADDATAETEDLAIMTSPDDSWLGRDHR